MSTPRIGPPLYLFLDESGNFDFTVKGSKFFILTAVSTFRPFPWEQELIDLRYDLWERRPDLEFEYFHASENKQYVRDRTFAVLGRHLKGLRVDSIVVEKNRTHPTFREYSRFYPNLMGYLLKYVFGGYKMKNISDVKVITDHLPFNKKRRAVEKAIKETLAKMIRPDHRYSLQHLQSKTCLGLQVADYFCWTIGTKWERGEYRSYDLIKDAVHSEFPIFKDGLGPYY